MLAERSRYYLTGRRPRDERRALPAGHPVSWGAITAGTLLDGAAFPPPAMTRAERTPRKVPTPRQERA